MNCDCQNERTKIVFSDESVIVFECCNCRKRTPVISGKEYKRMVKMIRKDLWSEMFWLVFSIFSFVVLIICFILWMV